MSCINDHSAIVSIDVLFLGNCHLFYPCVSSQNCLAGRMSRSIKDELPGYVCLQKLVLTQHLGREFLSAALSSIWLCVIMKYGNFYLHRALTIFFLFITLTAFYIDTLSTSWLFSPFARCLRFKLKWMMTCEVLQNKTIWENASGK